MAYKKKSWTEKLNDSKDFPRVEKLTPKLSKQWGAEGTVVIPTPREVDEIMKRIPKGKLTVINDIREFLAKKHNATISCPICTGIFASIAARAAEEEKAKGKRRFTPYWRTLKAGGEINPKYPGGVVSQKTLLEAEGHEVFLKGKKWVVYDFENKLVKL